MVGLVGECFMFASVLIHWFWLFSQFWNDLFSKLISLATCWERLLSSVEPTFSPIGEHCFSWGRRRQHLAQWRPIFPRAAWNGCAHRKQTRICGGRRWLKRSQPLRSSPGPSFPLTAQHIGLATLPGGGEGSAGRRRPLQRRRSRCRGLCPGSPACAPPVQLCPSEFHSKFGRCVLLSPDTRRWALQPSCQLPWWPLDLPNFWQQLLDRHHHQPESHQ